MQSPANDLLGHIRPRPIDVGVFAKQPHETLRVLEQRTDLRQRSRIELRTRNSQ